MGKEQRRADAHLSNTQIHTITNHKDQHYHLLRTTVKGSQTKRQCWWELDKSKHRSSCHKQLFAIHWAKYWNQDSDQYIYYCRRWFHRQINIKSNVFIDAQYQQMTRLCKICHNCVLNIRFSKTAWFNIDNKISVTSISNIILFFTLSTNLKRSCKVLQHVYAKQMLRLVENQTKQHLSAWAIVKLDTSQKHNDKLTDP